MGETPVPRETCRCDGPRARRPCHARLADVTDHGRDARATARLADVTTHGRDARATARLADVTDHGRDARATARLADVADHGRDARATARLIKEAEDVSAQSSFSIPPPDFLHCHFRSVRRLFD